MGLFVWLRNLRSPFMVVETVPEDREDESRLDFVDETVRVTVETSKGMWVWSGATNLTATILSHVAPAVSTDYVHKRTGNRVMGYVGADRITGVTVAMSFHATEVGDRRCVEFWPTGYVPTEEDS